MDTWLLALDCLINLGILGWLVYEYRRPAPVEVKSVVRDRGAGGNRTGRTRSTAMGADGDKKDGRRPL